jgi:hypothetical protein
MWVECNVLEEHFENVLQRYPELIEEGLMFSGRQVSLGEKFVDLLFEDGFGQKSIVELKKGIIKREHIAQLLDYEGHFLSDDNPNKRVMLIENRVPINLRKSLDHQWLPVSAFPHRHLSSAPSKYPVWQVSALTVGLQRYAPIDPQS